MLELCLMTSHAYPPGLVLHQEQGSSRIFKEFQTPLPSLGARSDAAQSGSFRLMQNQMNDMQKAASKLCLHDQLVKFDSTLRTPVVTTMQDPHLEPIVLSLGIAENCSRRESILQFIKSVSDELENGALDLSRLSESFGHQPLILDTRQLDNSSSIFTPTGKFDDQTPLLDFVGDMLSKSTITISPDGQVLLTGSKTEVTDILSAAAEYYLSKTSNNWRKATVVPYFERRKRSNARANVNVSLPQFEAATAAPPKSPKKINVNSPQKKKSRKVSTDRDLYKRNYFHACESLLSLMIEKRTGNMAISSIKKSGPELPELLAQFSAGIAGTGLAVLFSIFCKIACGRVPFCATKLWSTGFGLGLVWLSCAVKRLRDTVLYIGKNSTKSDLKEEMTTRVDKSVGEIYFRAAAVMAVAVLRLA